MDETPIDADTMTKEKESPRCVLEECAQAVEKWKEANESTSAEKVDNIHSYHEEENWCGEDALAPTRKATFEPLEIVTPTVTMRKNVDHATHDHTGSLANIYALM